MFKGKKAAALIIGLLCGSLVIGVGAAVSRTAPSNATKLPEPKTTSPYSIEEAIKNRRSEREYKPVDLTAAQISQLLWAAQGITDADWGLRSAPSAGAVYPLEIYVMRSTGIFHYLPQSHSLEQVSTEDRRAALSQAALGQAFVANAPVTFVIAADFQKVRQKYGGRTERYVYIEAGHAAENIHLQAVALGLGSIPVGAFWDDIAKKVISLPDNLFPIYIIPTGYVAAGQ